MNERRLLELATMLYFVSEDEQASKHFNTDVYRGAMPPMSICSTSACAIGWAGELYPEEIKWKRSIYGFPIVCPMYRGHTEGDAVAEFFGISRDDVRALFYPCRKQTSKEVADKIVKYVEKQFYPCRKKFYPCRRQLYPCWKQPPKKVADAIVKYIESHHTEEVL